MARRDPDSARFMDGVRMQALLEKSGDTWVAVHWVIGATDVWFITPELCAAYHAVIADFCR
jgi:ATP phosphoribosyltransferase